MLLISWKLMGFCEFVISGKFNKLTKQKQKFESIHKSKVTTFSDIFSFIYEKNLIGTSEYLELLILIRFMYTLSIFGVIYCRKLFILQVFGLK